MFWFIGTKSTKNAPDTVNVIKTNFIYNENIKTQQNQSDKKTSKQKNSKHKRNSTKNIILMRADVKVLR